MVNQWPLQEKLSHCHKHVANNGLQLNVELTQKLGDISSDKWTFLFWYSNNFKKDAEPMFWPKFLNFEVERPHVSSLPVHTDLQNICKSVIFKYWETKKQ